MDSRKSKYDDSSTTSYGCWIYDKYRFSLRGKWFIFEGKNLVLGYTFPSVLTEKMHLKFLRVYASVQNFFLVTKYSGYDPEVSDATQTFAQGITVFGYPKPRTFTIGLNVNF